MRIACLQVCWSWIALAASALMLHQFAPQVGDIDNNLNRADAVLSKANPQNLDLLVLPELAFSGYNFKSLQHISPYLEPTTAGITSLWARTTALKYECVVTVGYPEKVDVTPKWPASPEYYNSAITVNADGETIANYRKSFLYYADETWALEGPDGFFDGEIDGLGNVAMGICKWPTKSFERMDLNPYKFEAPWSAWEFAYHILHKQANLVILSMAWLTRENARSYSRSPKEPDMETLSYWLARLEPLIRAESEGEIICVFANRTGTEDEAVYAGTSAVLGIHAGEVKVYGILGRGERELLVVDTNKRPQAKLISQPGFSSATAKKKEGADSKPTAEVPDSRTNSSTSNKSRSSVSTSGATAGTTPDLEERPKNLNIQGPTSIDDIVTPLSPVDPSSQSAFFSAIERSQEGENLRKNLKSSIGQHEYVNPLPNSPTLAQRPSSPKSRNASRTRLLEDQEPALATHDLANEEQVKSKASKVKSPEVKAPDATSPQLPHSAAAAPDRYPSTFSNETNYSGGSRSGPSSPRPRSTVW
ncbi:carbon-nitrogen hydrolase [Leptodontidium sp. 2 PMI_412]|nr:carbon-nitrogen hydrolase [Leptodontidium sp. 2 PMI_412]